MKQVPDRLGERDAKVVDVFRLLGQDPAVATQKVGVVDGAGLAEMLELLKPLFAYVERLEEGILEQVRR